MKARIKGTDAVINVQPLYSEDRLHIEQFVNMANGDLFPAHSLDIIPNDTDWRGGLLIKIINIIFLICICGKEVLCSTMFIMSTNYSTHFVFLELKKK